MKNLKLTITLLLFATTAWAKPRFFVANFTANSTNYEVLFVFNGKISVNDPKNYTRTTFYSTNNHVIVSQDFESETGRYKKTDKTYVTIHGSNVRYITSNQRGDYSPDTYMFLYIDEDNITDPPFRQVDSKHSTPVSAVKKMEYGELTYDFLRKFFAGDDPQILYLLSLKDNKDFSDIVENPIPEKKQSVFSNSNTQSTQDQIFLHNGNVIKGSILQVGEFTIVYTYQGEMTKEVISRYAVAKLVHSSGREETISEKVKVSDQDDWEKVIILEDKGLIAGLAKVDEVEGAKWGSGAKADKKATEQLKRSAASIGCPFILMTSSHNSSYSGLYYSGTNAQRKGIAYRY